MIRRGRGAGRHGPRAGHLAPRGVVVGAPLTRVAARAGATPLAPVLVALASLFAFVTATAPGFDVAAAAKRLGVAVLLLAVTPLLWRRAAGPDREGRPPVPFLPAMCALYGVYFGLPGLVRSDFNPIGDMVSEPARVTALSLAWIGLASLLAGAHVVGALVPKVRLAPMPFTSALMDPGLPTGGSPPAVSSMAAPSRRAPAGGADLDPRSRRVARCAGRLIVVGIVMDIARTRGFGAAFGQVVPLLGLLAEVGIGALLLLALRGRLGRHQRLLLAVGAFVYLFLRVGEGSVAQAVFPAVAFLMMAWGAGRRVPWWVIVGGIALVALLRANAEAFRGETWDEGAAGSASMERSERFLEMAKESAGGDGLQLATTLALARLDQCAIFGYVVEETPAIVPYWSGGSYRTFLASFVPRAMWPDKPSKTVGQEFGHRYEILGGEDAGTSINLPLVVEMYANHGRLGVVLGMLLLGALYRWIQELLNRPGLGEGAVLVAAIVMSRMLNIESDFSLTFGALPYQVVAFLIVVRWMAPPARDAAVAR